MLLRKRGDEVECIQQIDGEIFPRDTDATEEVAFVPFLAREADEIRLFVAL